MKTEEIFKMIEDFIEESTQGFALCIKNLTSKMTIDGYNVIDGVEVIKDEDNEEIDSETYYKIEKLESHIFDSFANLLLAKECLKELTLPEILVTLQYKQDLSETMEMYREYRNTEEILNDGEDKNTVMEGTEK